jgi:hypothetical protein
VKLLLRLSLQLRNLPHRHRHYRLFQQFHLNHHHRQQSNKYRLRFDLRL